ncbi:hypothetical protein CVT24_010865 [Panaeolus cyanescens]|uniref:Uncharacterized protein n=1 Tax=Panaeolus cyanescens TaxID=181874 RepID=A0A409YVI3_9AGAR|nr:hypothetical protein CVT24_010865 [Panaeolus cyanescens]
MEGHHSATTFSPLAGVQARSTTNAIVARNAVLRPMELRNALEHRRSTNSSPYCVDSWRILRKHGLLDTYRNVVDVLGNSFVVGFRTVVNIQSPANKISAGEHIHHFLSIVDTKLRQGEQGLKRERATRDERPQNAIFTSKVTLAEKHAEDGSDTPDLGIVERTVEKPIRGPGLHSVHIGSITPIRTNMQQPFLKRPNFSDRFVSVSPRNATRKTRLIDMHIFHNYASALDMKFPHENQFSAVLAANVKTATPCTYIIEFKPDHLHRSNRLITSICPAVKWHGRVLVGKIGSGSNSEQLRSKGYAFNADDWAIGFAGTISLWYPKTQTSASMPSPTSSSSPSLSLTS